jgi:hypothetical protein
MKMDFGLKVSHHPPVFMTQNSTRRARKSIPAGPEPGAGDFSATDDVNHATN